MVKDKKEPVTIMWVCEHCGKEQDRDLRDTHFEWYNKFRHGYVTCDVIMELYLDCECGKDTMVTLGEE